MTKLSIRLFIIAILIGVALPISAQAQNGSSNAVITGHVKDPQGANVPGATVTLYARDRT